MVIKFLNSKNFMDELTNPTIIPDEWFEKGEPTRTSDLSESYKSTIYIKTLEQLFSFKDKHDFYCVCLQPDMIVIYLKNLIKSIKYMENVTIKFNLENLVFSFKYTSLSLNNCRIFSKFLLSENIPLETKLELLNEFETNLLNNPSFSEQILEIKTYVAFVKAVVTLDANHLITLDLEKRIFSGKLAGSYNVSGLEPIYKIIQQAFLDLDGYINFAKELFRKRHYRYLPKSNKIDEFIYQKVPKKVINFFFQIQQHPQLRYYFEFELNPDLLLTKYAKDKKEWDNLISYLISTYTLNPRKENNGIYVLSFFIRLYQNYKNYSSFTKYLLNHDKFINTLLTLFNNHPTDRIINAFKKITQMITHYFSYELEFPYRLIELYNSSKLNKTLKANDSILAQILNITLNPSLVFIRSTCAPLNFLNCTSIYKYNKTALNSIITKNVSIISKLSNSFSNSSIIHPIVIQEFLINYFFKLYQTLFNIKIFQGKNLIYMFTTLIEKLIKNINPAVFKHKEFDDLFNPSVCIDQIYEEQFILLNNKEIQNTIKKVINFLLSVPINQLSLYLPKTLRCLSKLNVSYEEHDQFFSHLIKQRMSTLNNTRDLKKTIKLYEYNFSINKIVVKSVKEYFSQKQTNFKITTLIAEYIQFLFQVAQHEQKKHLQNLINIIVYTVKELKIKLDNETLTRTFEIVLDTGYRQDALKLTKTLLTELNQNQIHINLTVRNKKLLKQLNELKEKWKEAEQVIGLILSLDTRATSALFS